MKRKLVPVFTIVFAVLLFTSSTSVATTYYVPDDYSAIQTALDAVDSGNTIIVRDGTYTGALNRRLDFKGKAITLRSENGPGSCVIDCGGTAIGFYLHSGESLDSVVDGFTITNAHGEWGGAISITDSSPTITNCVISGNSAVYCGGGIYCWNSNPTITNCIISGNSATNGGGGIYCPESTVLVANCTISDNTVGDNGGGIYCQQSTVTIFNCIFWGNAAPYGPNAYVSVLSHLGVSFSDFEGGSSSVEVTFNSFLVWGDANIDSDPLFVGGGDYHLTSDSPCIDAGTDAGIAVDIDGDARPQGLGYDIGADEYLSQTELTDVTLMWPPNTAWLSTPPTFMWEPDGGSNNAFAVEIILNSHTYSTYNDLRQTIYTTSWTMPNSIWNRIPHKTWTRWRVRGRDLDHSPVTITDSDWWLLYKQ